MNSETAVAVVGVGCRFPEAATPEEFWSNLDKGVVSLRDIPAEDLRRCGVSAETAAAPGFVTRSGWIEDPELFAAEFFGYPPVEAELIDPQQRLFLEACREGLERAGHLPNGAHGPQIGVFAGASNSTYNTLLQYARARTEGPAAFDDLATQLGGGIDFMAPRVSYKLGLRGPSLAVQTACSSSLTAVHYAVLSLLSEECDIALAGGSGLSYPSVGYQYQPGGVLSEDGFCRAFDIRSTGTGAGSGIGVVVLRRLADALADGDPVLAVIRGSAVGNDGAHRPGFTAPSPDGLASVVAAALTVAGTDPADLRYAEAHGSGTPLGDQVELRGLIDGLRAAGGRAADRNYCALGTVKANIGHAGSAAGIAGLIKGIHLARTGHLVPHPMFEHARDPGVLADSPFRVPTELERCTDTARQVLVNSMGLGGANASVVLAPPPEPVRPSAPARPVVRLQLSARTRTELDALSRGLADEIDQDRAPAGDIAHTLRVGRQDFAERRVVTAAPDRLAAALRLPRPPAARTVRAGTRRPVLAVTATGEHAEQIRTVLLAALGGRTEQHGAVPAPLPADAYLLILGEGESGPGRHVLPVDPAEDRAARDERIAAALADAWLHGVPVDARALDDGTGRRVALPTYPFTRRRCSALDDSVFTVPGAAATDPAPRAAARAQSDAPTGLEGELVSLWEELFGIDGIGLHDEFGALGGTSLLGLRMTLEVQERYGTLLNLHRTGGSRATVARVAEAVRGASGRTDTEGSSGTDTGPTAGAAPATHPSDAALIDADLALELPPLAPREAPPGTDVLLTGATGFVGAFLLHELLQDPGYRDSRVYCLVRADDEDHGRRRLRETAARFRLPEPDPARVHIVPGDLRDIAEVCETFRDGELARRTGHVVHCGAHVVFTEPYEVLRPANTLATYHLLGWMRRHGITDISYISTLAACGQALGSEGRMLERREQPLDPEAGGYGISKWVSERLLDKAERDGMRVRVFRPGLIGGDTATGACNDLDMLWRLVAACLAVGAHPADDMPLPVAPIDLVARAVVQLGREPGSAGRAYHLVGEEATTFAALFAELGALGAPTRPVPVAEWARLAGRRALETGDPVLSTMALYETHDLDTPRVDVEGRLWGEWLRDRGLDPRLDGARALLALRHLAGHPSFAALLTDVTEGA
ncbi:thioester reductase domain-containing protein [Streptomyces sp. NPDC059788]|uniref:thioester reductase domain-containing protein n=1 Tax=Streptomyces sp. NPDC059788 TaxID=3346948 RepID=UPI003662D12C